MRLPSVRLRAISPIIAMIIIVAITLSIAFAVVGWLFGLWGGLAGGTPQITITNVDGYINQTNKNITVRVYMMNKGTAGDEILEVRIVHAGKEITCNGTGYIVNAGYKGWLTFVCNKTGAVGDSFMLKIFFKNSGAMTVSGVISRQVS